jgi:hypothetical protein
MNIKAAVISSFASFIISSQIFQKIKSVVEKYLETKLLGPEKRSEALKELSSLGLDISSWALNLGLELAVAYFKNVKVK